MVFLHLGGMWIWHLLGTCHIQYLLALVDGGRSFRVLPFTRLNTLYGTTERSFTVFGGLMIVGCHT